MPEGWVIITGELARVYQKQKGNIYYDYMAGLMAKEWTTIDGKRYCFDEMAEVLKQ